MTMIPSQFASASELRSYMEWTTSTGRKSDANLDLLLQAGAEFLERRTGRVIASTGSNSSRKFTTRGRAYIQIPDLRFVTTVALNETNLTADETYWLIPSAQAPEIHTGIQVRHFTNTGDGPWYLGRSDWFDRGYDLPGSPLARDSAPNDLVITGGWGWDNPPPVWKLANMAMAGYLFQHADALLSGNRITPEGNIFDLSQLPTEVRTLIQDWELGELAAIT